MPQATEGTRTKSRMEWNDVNWRRVQRAVRQLRQRIYRASRQGDKKKVRFWQRLMLRSQANRLQSIRRVTQLNQGGLTARVDNLVVKTPEARTKLVEELRLHGQQRPLGIPTILGHCMQAVVKNALEPEWEARFEPCSYGFRPGRNSHDAIECIYGLSLPTSRKKWVVEADLQGAKVHSIISTTKPLKRPSRAFQLNIRQWLKAGVVDKGVVTETNSGTLQGGMINSLLANIALHGMESVIGVT